MSLIETLISPRAVVDVSGVRRRPPGDRALVYLDQSTLSELVREPAQARLLELLRRLVADGTILCPQSMSHHDESILNATLHAALDDLADELSAGVSFHFDDHFTRWCEISAAAAAFSGVDSRRDLWHEAFLDDPQKPVEALHPPFRVRVRGSRQDWMVEEVESERAKAALLAPIREQIHASGRTFAEQAALEYTVLVQMTLEPLLYPEQYERRRELACRAAALDMMRGNVDVIGGSAFSRYAAIYDRGSQCESIADMYPEVAARIAEFAASAELAAMPTLRFPALLHAGLGTGSPRKPKPSDLHDIAHLTNGLGRCDIVTCDVSMAQVCREHRTVPPGVKLFSARELDRLERELETLA